MDRKALVVGIDDYEHVSKLHGAVNDATRIAKLFANQHDGGKNFDVRLLTSAADRITSRVLRDHIQQLFDGTGERVFFFAGHGASTPGGAYLVTQEADQDHLGLSMHEVLVHASGSSAAEIVLIVDACHAAELGHDLVLNVATVREGISILAACRREQEALEASDGGLFTDALVKGLEGAAADRRGVVSSASLCVYANERFESAWGQRPVFQNNTSGVFELRRCSAGAPAVWNVPRPQNAGFVGRDDILDATRRRLAEARRVALVGLGGVGKSQLAAEYCYRFGRDYSIVWWISGEEEAALGAGLMDLAQVLGVEQGPQEAMLQGLRSALAALAGSWLIVVDDLQRPRELPRLIPDARNGHCMMTSRERGLGPAVELEVGPFGRAESAEYLAKHLRPDAAFDALACALGHLPLALAQATAYARQAGMSATEYLELFRTRRREMWALEPGPLDYDASVATTWRINMEPIEGDQPEAANLARLASFFGADEIPFELLKAAGAPPEGLTAFADDPLRWWNALGILSRFSLIKVVGSTISIHCLAQAVVRDRLSEPEAQAWSARAAKSALRAWPTDGEHSPQWPKCARLVSHALAAARHARRIGSTADEHSTLFNKVSLYLRARGELELAARIMTELLGDTEYGTV